jgi:hypothetical protein
MSSFYAVVALIGNKQKLNVLNQHKKKEALFL